ncbi:hypothetical protein [Dyadobacter sp. CY345]|nr:hypothetical protein [Dyadobacter sp. CY345]
MRSHPRQNFTSTVHSFKTDVSLPPLFRSVVMQQLKDREAG